jgi:hypothetical protein
MQRITKQRIKEYLDKNCYLEKNYLEPFANTLIEIYRSKIDGSYVTLNVPHIYTPYIKFLIKNNIHEIQSYGDDRKSCCASIGFNSETNTWYGWSHRAYYGFTIGSVAKKGDCAYVPTDKYDYINSMVDFFEGNSYNEIDDKKFEVVFNKEEGKIHTLTLEYPTEYGRGEWVAETLEDAKQMAIDFAKGVE